MLNLAAISAYVMAEVGLASWLTTFLVHARRFSVTSAPPILSGFYLTFTAGRLLAHNWLPRLGNVRSILLSASVSVVLVALAIGGPAWMVYLIIPAGLAFSIIFPTITAAASAAFSDHAGKVLGLLFSASWSLLFCVCCLCSVTPRKAIDAKIFVLYHINVIDLYVSLAQQRRSPRG